MAKSLSQLAEIADHASKLERSESVRLKAAMLSIALGDTADTIANTFVPNCDRSGPKSVFEAVRKDHQE